MAECGLCDKVRNLTRYTLIEMDPTNSDYYTENSNKHTELLKKLDEGIRKSMGTIPLENRKLFTYHDSWDTLLLVMV